MTAPNPNAPANNLTNAMKAMEDDTRPNSMPGSNARASSEEKLDQMLADSFPASDPPSFTPVTGESKPRVTPDPLLVEPASRISWRLLAIAGAAFLGQVAAFIWLLARLKSRSGAHPSAASGGAVTPPQ